MTPTPAGKRAQPRPSHYDVAGPGGAPPIVFVHGIRVTRRQWLPQMRGLADAYRLVALDLPGHGSRASTPFSLDAATDLLAATIDRAAGGRALVVGLSLGGYVAMNLAAQQPEKVAGLVLTGCTANPRGVLRVVPATIDLLSRAVGDRWLTCINRANVRARYDEEIAREQIEAGFYFRGMQDALRELQGQDFLRTIRAYPGPVLILNGERDNLCRLEEVLFLAAAQSARLQLVPGAGHAASLERPDAYNRAVASFARCVDWKAPVTPAPRPNRPRAGRRRRRP